MSHRLYYDDAYSTSFQAQVSERFAHNGNPAVVLDQTFFYPTSGGQPADRGFLNSSRVVDVFIREDDGAVVHVLADELWESDVTGQIDWERRFDHMQQHTAQHILSQAFLRVAEARTVGFHLTENSLTIDLHRADLKPAEVEQAELMANQVIWDDRPVNVRTVTREQAEELSIRKLPDIEGDELRLIEIPHFDLTACGGTHVHSTGAVGMVKIVGLERRAYQLRVSFVAGRRALLDYRLKNRIINRLAAEFTTSITEVENSVVSLREEAQAAHRRLRQQRVALLAYEAAELRAVAEPRNGVRVLARVFVDRDPSELRDLAKKLVEEPGIVMLLGGAGEKAQLVFARSEDVTADMNQLLKSALAMLDKAGGGGSPAFAQGGGPAADQARIRQAVGRAERLLLAQIGD